MNRDFIIVLALAIIALLCFPLLSLIMTDVTPASIANVFATPTPLEPPTPTVAPRAYLLPFRQAFAINQAAPITRTNFLLYENGTDVFHVIGQQDKFTRLETLDGKLNFWTTTESISHTPPESAVYDFANRGKTIRLVPQTGFACLHEDAPPPVFAACQQLPNFSTAKLTAKITAGAITIYLVEIDGKSYFLPPENVLAIP